MDFKGALLSRVLADGSVAAIVAARGYWGQRVQGEPLPAVVLHRISEERTQHLKGFNDLRQTFVQVDCLSLSSVVSSDLAEAVVAALVPEATVEGIIFNRAMVDDIQDDGEQVTEGFVYRTRVDLSFWWQVE